MAQLTVQQVSSAGADLDAALVAADPAGDTFTNSGLTFVVVRNGGASAITVTVPAAVPGVTLPTHGSIPIQDLTVNVGAGQTVVFQAPFGSYGSNATLNYSSTTSVSVGVFQLTSL